MVFLSSCRSKQARGRLVINHGKKPYSFKLKLEVKLNGGTMIANYTV